MKKEPSVPPEDEEFEMRDEYDFTAEDIRNAPRGEYVEWYHRCANVVVLEPDVLEVFPNSEAVNRALRGLADIIKERERDAEQPSAA